MGGLKPMRRADMARFKFDVARPVEMRGPRQGVEDVTCLKCEDLYEGEDVLDGWCFGCRLKDNIVFKRRMKMKPSYRGEAELIFPTGR